jgi:hypothetical protein
LLDRKGLDALLDRKGLDALLKRNPSRAVEGLSLDF